MGRAIYMERETAIHKPKLIVAASHDYPAADEILISFPNQWQLVSRLERDPNPYYITAMPASETRPESNKFSDLSPELNSQLATYRLYRLFQPWPMPRVTISWNAEIESGWVEEVGDLNVQLQPVGQAQVWQGTTSSVLWECFLYDRQRMEPGWQDELAAFWDAVERDVGSETLFTPAHEPTVEKGFSTFLQRLVYTDDPTSPNWWRKSFTE